MTYFARSENASGERETITHHLRLVSDLCSQYTGEFGYEEIGKWLGVYHDFGKYSPAFQNVLNHQQKHVDHALPGAAFLVARLNIKPNKHGLRCSNQFWPLTVCVRSHHGPIEYDWEPELVSWMNGERRTSYGGKFKTYALSCHDLNAAITAFCDENKDILPNTLPEVPECCRTKETGYEIRIMLFTRILFSSLTDADYSASALHFNPNYLEETSTAPFNPSEIWDKLSDTVKALSKQSNGDPTLNQMRNDLFQQCVKMGQILPNGVYTLTAPTGMGKTLDMLAFALQQMICNGKRRIVVVLPFLSIIEQNAAVYRKILPDVLEDHSQADCEDDTTASRELSQRWDAPFIITTSVKFFESLFSCTGPSCRKLHNLSNCVILFDEAQSLPPTLAETTLTTLKELSCTYRSTVLFSTATQPDFDALPDVTWTPKEIVPNPQELFDKSRRVSVRWHLDEAVTFDEIANDAAKDDQVCFIVNLRRHALSLYERLCVNFAPCDIFLLTSDLCPAHRTQILNEVKRRLRKHLPCMLVATQCIEAGVDISFDVVYRALAPLESLIQAAGRCNRGDTRREGRFTVFIPADSTLYPDDFYQHAANVVKTISKRHTIDLVNLKHIKEYYQLLFGTGAVSQNKQLANAIKSLDFQGVAQNYKLIEDNQLQVLVPCPGREEEVEALAEEGRRGITASWIRRAAPFIVNSYQRDGVLTHCENLCMYLGREREPVSTPYYILGDTRLYSQEKGLMLSASASSTTQYIF